MRASTKIHKTLDLFNCYQAFNHEEKKYLVVLFEERKWKNKPCRMINHNSMIHRATIVAKYWICHLKVVVAAGVYGFILVVTLIFILVDG